MPNPPENVDTASLIDARVRDAAGHEAFIASVHTGEGVAQARVQLADGMQVLVPVGLLSPVGEREYRLPFGFDVPQGSGGARMAFPVMEEVLHVDKRRVDTGSGLRVHKSVTEREHIVDQPLRRDELVVEHVPVGQMVAEGMTPSARYEGDTLVVPVLEEVLVVQKRLLLKEEVRVTRRQCEVHAPQTVRLRSEHVSVERFGDGQEHGAG